MRVFIAVPLPSQIRKHLAKIREDFRKFPAKWVEEENIHITLVFLGETDETEVTKATEAIDTSVKGFKPVDLRTGDLTLLPNEKKPRLLVVKLRGEIEKLSELAETIKKELRERKVNFDEKPFRPHITLARLKRLKSGEKRELRGKVRAHELPKMEFKVRQIELTESKLTPAGPVYEVLKTILLK